MGFFMLAGLVGSVLYSSYAIKNDIQAEIADKKTQSTPNSDINENNIKRNFKTICKRCRIKLDNKGNPINKNKLFVAREYLQYQGYSENEIQVFTRLFNYKHRLHEDNKAKIRNNDLKELLNKLNDSQCTEQVIYRHKVYGNGLDIDTRMEKTLEHRLWSRIVYRHSYILGSNGAKWEEIWTLKVPKDFFSDMSVEEVHRNVCEELNIYWF